METKITRAQLKEQINLADKYKQYTINVVTGFLSLIFGSYLFLLLGFNNLLKYNFYTTITVILISFVLINIGSYYSSKYIVSKNIKTYIEELEKRVC